MASVKNIVRVANVTKTFQLGKIDVQALKGSISKSPPDNMSPSWGLPVPVKAPSSI
jgi:hypothetical protein